jgi:hypothetical protein
MNDLSKGLRQRSPFLTYFVGDGDAGLRNYTP